MVKSIFLAIIGCFSGFTYFNSSFPEKCFKYISQKLIDVKWIILLGFSNVYNLSCGIFYDQKSAIRRYGYL